MAFPLVPRIILLLASIAAYLPQFQAILSHHDVIGISGVSVLINNLIALEQFAIIICYVATRQMAYGYVAPTIMRSPISPGDWVNIAQITTTWLLSLLLFMLWATYSPSGLLKWTYLLLWVIPSLIVIYISIDLFGDKSNEGFADFWAGIWTGVHRMYISPVCSVFALVAFIPQFYLILSTGRAGVLSATFLYSTSIVYACLALSWPYRMYLPPDTFWDGGWYIADMAEHWFEFVGWAPIDSALFALVQLVLYLVILTLSRHGGQYESVSGDTRPLLG